MATKKVAGLPRMPEKFKLDARPTRKGKCIRHGGGFTFTFSNGYLDEVVNPKGRLGPVAIVETGYPGWTVRSDRPPYAVLGYGYRKVSKLALRLALKGHKRVTIRD